MSESSKAVHEELRSAGLDIANKLDEAFPHLSEGIMLRDFEVSFGNECLDQTAPVASTVYDQWGTNLKRVEINSERIQEQFLRVDDQVSFTDLVRMHVGIAVSLDLLFQHSWKRGMKGQNVAQAMVDTLGDVDSIKDALRSIGPDFQISGFVDMAVNKIVYDKEDPTDEAKARANAVRINAQRQAIGMVIFADETHGERASLEVTDAIRDDIRKQLGDRAKAMSVLAYALTGNYDLSQAVAADMIVAVRDLPLAIPASRQEIAGLLASVRAANHKEESLGLVALAELMDDMVGRDGQQHLDNDDLRLFDLGEYPDTSGDDEGDHGY